MYINGLLIAAVIELCFYYAINYYFVYKCLLIAGCFNELYPTCLKLFLVGPRNISIGPQKNDYSPEDTLVCSADGNPPPTYEWIELSDPRTVFKEPELHLNKTVTAVAGTRQYTYNCTATNRIAIVSSTIRCNVTGENRSDVSSPACNQIQCNLHISSVSST